ncbi:5-dehydro-2-deoxygluconokinase [Streptomyces lincolnensis]|uniref:PfkB family carbohydrate kinase n=1 Tax=Streptomyces lincolnensis TaxID=1915 RepID=UPI001E3CE9C9|nr:PfkB family carbohydrate kinase [Streptomyces lincolnensis]MCD7443407.1 5-dehydro-2-deoxygluconokinase [Streptomyces lincolnensis]
MAESVQHYDVISMGRIGVDLYPPRSGTPSPQVGGFNGSLGGSAANVAVAAARLGRSTAVITRTGADPFGTYLHQTLTASGVDDRWVTASESTTDALDYFAVRAARILWITGSGLSAEPTRSATLAALKARGRTGTTVFDLDWRPACWVSPEEARPYYAEAVRHATVAVGDLDACEIATGVREPRACAEALLAAGVELALVKRPGGVLAVHRDGTATEIPSVTAEVADAPDAGDAFGGALCHGLLSGWEAERLARYAHAAGALMASRPAESTGMPTAAEIEDLLAQTPQPSTTP